MCNVGRGNRKNSKLTPAGLLMSYPGQGNDILV